MLVLTRKKDEQIRIGDDIIITVIRVKGKAVRLGIQAPRTEPVLRGELEFREPRSSNPPAESSNHSSDEASVADDGIAPTYRLRRPLREFLSSSVATH